MASMAESPRGSLETESQRRSSELAQFSQLDLSRRDSDSIGQDDVPPSTKRSSLISTRSLHADDLTTVEENGRTYPDDQYYLPSDAGETLRMNIMHRVYTAALGGELTVAPISHENTSNPTGAGLRILDVGTGPGDWALAVQEKWPDAEVTAVDIGVWPELESTSLEATTSPASATDDSPSSQYDSASVQWEIDNLDARPYGWTPSLNTHTHSAADSIPIHELENRWAFHTPFDLIHFRGMKGVFSHWLSVYRSAYAALEPGGWIEICDYDFFRDEVLLHHSDPSTMSRLLQYVLEVKQAMAETGRPLNTAHMQPALLERAGFVDVWTKVVDVVIGEPKTSAGKARATSSTSGRPPDDPEERSRVAGKLWFVCLLEACEAIGMRTLTRQAGWTAQQVLDVCETVRGEIQGGVCEGIRTPFYFVRARKPFNEP